MQQDVCAENGLIPAGYGSRNDKTGWIRTLVFEDRAEAEKYIAKRNARHFIDDEDARDELVELFYRKVK